MRAYCSPALPICRALLTGLVFASCSGDVKDAVPAVERRDSAGVRIVEASRPAWDESSRWRIDPVPLVDLAASGTGPEHVFYRVGGMVRFNAMQNTFLKCALAYSRDFQTPQEPDFNFDIQAREGDVAWIVGDWTAGPLQIHRVGDSASFIAKLPNGGVATVSITPHVVVGAFKAVASRHRVHITPERRTPQLVIVQLEGYCFTPRE